MNFPALVAGLLAAGLCHTAQAASVCFFELDNYRGAAFCADASAPLIGRIWNERISSVRVPAGASVKLYEHTNYGGRMIELTADAASIGGFDNLTSSYQITQPAPQAQVWVTHPDRSRLLSWDGTRSFDGNAAVDAATITVDETTRYQQIDGFGAALTDSSSWLIQNRLNEAQREALMRTLFGTGEGQAGISYLRIPLGASDFSTYHYTFDDTCCDLGDFSIDHDRAATIPLALKAKALSPNLKFMGSPWSPPAWMKTSNALNWGKLRGDHYPIYADYLRRTFDDYQAAGVTFDAMTIQNEPRHEPLTYPGTKYEWYDELNFVRGHLAARMAGTGVKLVTFDHNWNLDWYPKAVMNEGQPYYEGSAWHCYGGNVSAMTGMHNAYPSKSIYLTECTGTFTHNNFGANLKWNMQNMFIGGTRNWAKTVLLWNLALDPTGQPHTGGCSNCRGVVTIDQANGHVTLNEEFYAIAHFSRFVRPGAERIASSNSSDGRFISAAFRNANGSKAMVVLNQGSTAGAFRTVFNGRSVAVDLPASGVATLIWN
jgi:glucosylceramidase